MMFHLFVPRVPWNQWSHSAKGLMSAHVFAAGATEYAGAVREHVQGRRLRDRESAVRHSCPPPARPHARPIAQEFEHTESTPQLNRLAFTSGRVLTGGGWQVSK